jgi:hypothetical protein
MVAEYDGKGDKNDAASFVCANLTKDKSAPSVQKK